jgi:hypothetical protein
VGGTSNAHGPRVPRAAEFAALAEAARSASEKREFRALHRNFASLAGNKECQAGGTNETSAASWPIDHAGLEERILRRLGAAVIMWWSTLPKKIQKELFKDAGCIGDLQQMTELKRTNCPLPAPS